MGHRAIDFRIKVRQLWEFEPYADPKACWGCGLEPHVLAPAVFPMNPRRPFCVWCDELRTLLWEAQA